ncbi:MAG: DUF434 domain-containing protein, partial [Planctomycetales bacterium]
PNFSRSCKKHERQRYTVPDQRQHRGPHPQDHELFSARHWPVMQQAAADLSWLLSRGYATASSLGLVGDRYRLVERQRKAVARCSCSDASRARRESHCVPAGQLVGETLAIDGYNLLTTLEAALGGGIVLHARDGAFRDMASMHGTYRKVAETLPALIRIGEEIHAREVAACRWLLDRPVSNSGRLKKIIEELAAEQDWNWTVELVPDPDPILCKSEDVVVTADSMILDACQRWTNLAHEIIEHSLPDACVVPLTGDEPLTNDEPQV